MGCGGGGVGVMGGVVEGERRRSDEGIKDKWSDGRRLLLDY